MLSGPEQALLALLLVVLMMGMGASLTLADFRAVLQRPRGPLIGLASQYGWMPLIAFTLARALELPNDQAISLIIVGCTPGGTTSNLFTYYAKADVALSISMTALSTIVAVVVMPLLLVVYASSFSDATLKVPYGNITTTLAVMLVPLALGMFVRARKPAAAGTLEKVGSLAGIGVLALLIVTGLVRNGELLAQTTPAMYVAAIGLGVLGFGLGYLLAALLRLERAGRRAIAFETGIQNSPLALGIILASFPAALHERMLWLPLLYALFVLLSASLLTLWWRRAA
ncbi:bile acid:sodium symporter [Nannocystis sp. SCPEA4]|uniref:bile acid:sodium symporter n=1 Tax=Nannocystis sp. SCPEA4 TaxID=2996787 RepID=UPI00226EAA5D|nr:bile acid:sodium symporter [Nannocystis sp. SCPEA4]MCY1056283.1 bile acid:sodium symporter [Nannocystis sp. SCPEA4]